MFKSQFFDISTPCFQKHHYSSYTVIVFPSELVPSDPAASVSLVRTGATQLCVLVQSPCPSQQASSSVWWHPHVKSLITKTKALWWISLFFCCCCFSVAQSCLTLCDPMDCSTPGFPSITNSWSLRKLMCIESVMPSNHLIFSHPLLLLSQHQGLFQWVSSLGGQNIEASASASVLPINIQGWFPLGLTDLISLQAKGLSRVFSSTVH